jgi:hypothetical protein
MDMRIVAAKKVISYWVKFTQRHHYGDVSVDGKIFLKLICQK